MSRPTVPTPTPSAGSRAARPGLPVGASAHRLLGGACAAVLALTLLGWALLYRNVLFTGDDFNHVSRGGHPGGRMSAGEIWQSYVTDYTQVNGRAADAFARLILQNDVHTWQVLGPVVITAITACIGLWATLGAPRGLRRVQMVPALLLAAAVPFALLAVRPVVGGQVFFWVTAAIGYLTAILLTLISGLYFATALRRPVARGWAVAAGAAVVLTHLFHETASFALMAIVAAFWLLGGRAVRTRQNLLISGVSVAAFLANALAPGALSRFSRYDSEPAEGGLAQHLANVERGAIVLLNLVWPALVLIALVVAVRLLTRRTVAGLSLLTGTVLLLVWALVRHLGAATPAQLYAPEGIDRAQPYLFAVVLGLLVWYAVGVGAELGRTPALLLAATAGAAAIPVALGAWDRGHVPAAFFAYAFALALALPVLTEAWAAGRRGPVLGLAALACLAAAGTVVVTGVQTDRGLAANARVWEVSARQIEQARQGERDVVFLPDARRMPAPALVYHNGWNEARFGYIRSYYEIPADVEIRHRSAPTSR